MIRVRWDLEEAVVLFDVYFKNNCSLNISKDILDNLTRIYKNREKKLEMNIDEKFRNASGLKMQLACIHYVVNDGKCGLSKASKLFYDTYDLYKNDNRKFNDILNDFYKKYSS